MAVATVAMNLVGCPLLSAVRLLHVAASRRDNVESMALVSNAKGRNGIVDCVMQAINGNPLHPDTAFMIEVLKKVFKHALGDCGTSFEDGVENNPIPPPDDFGFGEAMQSMGGFNVHQPNMYSGLILHDTAINAMAPSPAPGLEPVHRVVAGDDPLSFMQAQNTAQHTLPNQQQIPHNPTYQGVMPVRHPSQPQQGYSQGQQYSSQQHVPMNLAHQPSASYSTSGFHEGTPSPLPAQFQSSAMHQGYPQQVNPNQSTFGDNSLVHPNNYSPSAHAGLPHNAQQHQVQYQIPPSNQVLHEAPAHNYITSTSMHYPSGVNGVPENFIQGADMAQNQPYGQNYAQTFESGFSQQQSSFGPTSPQPSSQPQNEISFSQAMQQEAPTPEAGEGIDARTPVDPNIIAEQRSSTAQGAPGCAHGRLALLHSALECGLAIFLVKTVLENPTIQSVKDPAAVKVHAVELLNILASDPGFGMKFNIMLDAMPEWGKYKAQDHSLFITGGEQKVDYFLTNGDSDPKKLLTQG